MLMLGKKNYSPRGEDFFFPDRKIIYECNVRIMAIDTGHAFLNLQIMRVAIAYVIFGEKKSPRGWVNVRWFDTILCITNKL